MASNVLFSNGRLDPWRGGGVQKSNSEGIVTVIIEGKNGIGGYRIVQEERITLTSGNPTPLTPLQSEAHVIWRGNTSPNGSRKPIRGGVDLDEYKRRRIGLVYFYGSRERSPGTFLSCFRHEVEPKERRN